MAVADKIAVALTALVLTAGLAACGDSGESEEGGGEQEQEQENEGEEQEDEDDD